MKKFHSFLRCAIAAALLLSLLLASCAAQTDGDGTVTTTTPPQTTPTVTDPVITGYLPQGTPAASLTCGDGTQTKRYKNMTAEDFQAATAYFEQTGYTEYCSGETENTLSATYTNGDAFATLFFRKGWNDLSIGLSDSGALSFPARNTAYEKICDTAITQPGLSQDGGMCEIFRLADGSFLIFDSGNPPEYSIIYNELCRLNGSSENIHIRAWMLTHSHGDHYGGFVSFAKNYADLVQLDYVLYSPLARAEWDTMDSYQVSWNTIDYYFNSSLQNLLEQYYPFTNLCSVHAGQTFTFADITLEILYTPEFVYMDEVPVDSNNTSVVSRVVSEEGSVLLMADCGEQASQWILKTYHEELKSDMMQATHHGMLTNTDLKIMRRVQPTTYFWPCSEAKFNMYWGIDCEAKQYAIAETENLLHGYGSATRPLSYRGSRPEGVEILQGGMEIKSNGVTVTQTETGVISYTVQDAADPYISFATKIDTARYNALRVTLKSPSYQKCHLSWTSGSQTPFEFSSENQKLLGPQGNTSDRVVTLLVYMGNGIAFQDDITSLRIDMGTAAEQTVTVYSIEAFYIELEP